MIEGVVRPVRYASRLLLRSPLFTATAILSLSLGIGANTAIFTAANALLLAPTAGIREMDRVVDLGRTVDGTGFDTVAYPLYADLRERVPVFENVYANRLEPLPISLGGQDAADRIYGAQVSDSFFDTLGVRAAAGDLFHTGEERIGVPLRKVVLAHAFWKRRFAESPSIVGAALQLNGESFVVSGVAAKGFHGSTIIEPDIWIPLTAGARGMVSEAMLRSRESSMVTLGARLKPGVTRSQAQESVNGFMRALATEYPTVYERRGLVVAPASRLPGQAGTFVGAFMAILMALVGLVLLVACANIGGLLLARAASRSREVAVRLALGASRLSLMGLLTTEALLLFGMGAIAALGVAYAITGLIASALAAVPFPLSVDLAFDWRVLLFTSALSLLTGLLTGLVPALQSARADLVSDLKSDASARRRQRLRSVFVGTQIAFCVVLIVAAGVLLRALDSATHIDPGFDVDGVDVASVDFTLGGYSEDQAFGVEQDLRARFAALPGVDAVGIAAKVPLDGGGIGLGGLRRPGSTGRSEVDADWNVISSDFLPAMRETIVRGRNFSDADREGAPLVAIVNEHFASTLWPGDNAIGQVLENGDLRPQRTEPLKRITVVGVTRTAKYRWRGEAPRAFIYVPLAQQPWRNVHYFLRRSDRLSGGSTLQPAVRQALRNFDPKMPLVQMRPLRQFADLGLLPQRMAAALAGALGMVALLLGAIGLYGICAFAVASRTKEIGIRMALGADPRRVTRLVLAQGLRPTAMGTAAGLIGASGLTQLLSGLLLGISPIDPPAFGGAIAALATVALGASYVPARRAARVNPVSALRSD